MPIRAWLGISVLGAVAACSAPAASTALANTSVDGAPVSKTRTVNVPQFGDVAIEDGALQLMDRGSGDERVHVVTVSRDYRAMKSSWADRPGPRTEVRSDSFELSGDERAQIRSWSEELWQLA